MPPPPPLLQDTIATFGVTPLLFGAELAVAAGDRACLVGRTGPGRSTLLRIAAGLAPPDAGDRFAQPGATIHYLPQEPDLSGFATTLAYVEAGFGAETTDSRHRALYLLEELGLSGEGNPAALSDGAARLAALAPSSISRCWTNRPTISTCRYRAAGARVGRDALRYRVDQPRSPPARAHLTYHDLARPRHHPDPQPGLQAIRALARGDSGAGGGRAAPAWPQDRDGGGLAALWRIARRTHNQRRLAELPALRRQRKEQRTALGSIRLEAAQADVSSRLVAVARGISKSAGGRPVVRDFSARITRGHRVGLVGPNMPARRHCS
jgi:ABC transport system ATP-binding/permease protein